MHLDFNKTFDLGSHKPFGDQVKKHRQQVRLHNSGSISFFSFFFSSITIILTH